MKKIVLLLIFLTVLISCKTKNDKSCVKWYMEDRGYSYKDACKECEDIEENVEEDLQHE